MQFSKRAKGRLWKVAGVILIVLGIIALISIIAALSIASNGKQNGGIVAVLVFFWFGAGGMACIRYGQRVGAPTAEEVLSRDARPPVLYLRSFEEDRVTSKWSDFKNVVDYIWPFSKSMELETEEITIAKVMKQLGPFIAVGQPSEELPELGAARVYLEADWQEQITRLITQARLVVFRFGTMVTQGVGWEIQKAIELLQPKQLLLLIAFLPGEEYEYFRERVNKYFPCQFPDFPKRKIFNKFYENRINAVIYFTQDWSPQIVPLKGKKRRGELARELERVLKPMAIRLGQIWKRPITMRHRAVLLGISLYIAAAMIVSAWVSGAR